MLFFNVVIGASRINITATVLTSPWTFLLKNHPDRRTVEPLHNGHLGAEESGHCGEVANVERFKQESMYGLFAKKVAAVERWLL